MKKKELIRRIEDGFEELAPDIFEAVMEKVEEKKGTCFEIENETNETEIPGCKRESFWFGKSFGKRFPGYVLSACASLALICLCIFTGIRINETKKDTVYMVLDINPSIQIEMNSAFQVKHLEGLNQDGKNVVEKLEWEKEESVEEFLNDLLLNVVEKSYLNDDGAILITLSKTNGSVCEELEQIVEESIELHLAELDLSNVKVASWQTDQPFGMEGRRCLEEELVKRYSLSEEEAGEMTVSELILYCQEHAENTLKVSEMNPKEAVQKAVAEPSNEADRVNTKDQELQEKSTQEKTETDRTTEEEGSETVLKKEETDQNQDTENESLPPQQEAPAQNEVIMQNGQEGNVLQNSTGSADDETKNKKPKKNKSKKKKDKKDKEEKKKEEKEEKEQKKKEEKEEKERKKKEEKEEKEQKKKEKKKEKEEKKKEEEGQKEKAQKEEKEKKKEEEKVSKQNLP